MDKNRDLSNERSLAQIESDLLKSEAEFVEANARLKELESICCTALCAINEHQAEFDQAVSVMRQRSIAGTKWQLEMSGAGDVLHHMSDDDSDLSNPGDGFVDSMPIEFERLRKITELEDASPCVIITKN